MTVADLRVEHDLLGDYDVPDAAYYGVHTARALDEPSDHRDGDLAISRAHRRAGVRETGCRAGNHRLGILGTERADANVAACQEIKSGRLHDQFVVDVIQGGAGTSTNMNANEVIANRALELLGHRRGDYRHLHPLEHVNLSQSTNDVYPTALKIALQFAVRRLQLAMAELVSAFADKAVEFGGHLKMGRTQLQDAVPMTLGQEFGSYAVMVGEDGDRLGEAVRLISEINLGETAIGTGLNAHRGYAEAVCDELCALTDLLLVRAPNLVEATQDVGAFVQLSGVLKRTALKLSKICNDLRLLSSGPACRPGRDQSACGAGRFEHHAGKGQSRDSRGGQSSRVRGDRQ